MKAGIGYVAGGLVALISATAALWFLLQILLWTYDLAGDPLGALLRMMIWLVPCAGSCYFLRSLRAIEKADTERIRLQKKREAEK